MFSDCTTIYKFACCISNEADSFSTERMTPPTSPTPCRYKPHAGQVRILAADMPVQLPPAPPLPPNVYPVWTWTNTFTFGYALVPQLQGVYAGASTVRRLQEI